MLRTPTDIAGRTRFKRAAFHQGIAPAAQCRDVDIDPVIPPIDGFRFERKGAAFVFRKRGGKQTSVFAFEYMFVVQNERLVQFYQFFGAIQIPPTYYRKRPRSF